MPSLASLPLQNLLAEKGCGLHSVTLAITTSVLRTAVRMTFPPSGTSRRRARHTLFDIRVVALGERRLVAPCLLLFY